MQIHPAHQPNSRRTGGMLPVLVPAALALFAAPAWTGGGAGIEWRTDVGFTTAYGKAFSGHHAVDSQGNVFATSSAWSYATAKLSPAGVPLNHDALFVLSLAGLSDASSGFYGLIPCDGSAFGSIQIPAAPAVSGIAFHVASAAVPYGHSPPPWGISSRAPIQIQ